MVPDRFMRASCCINPSQLKISMMKFDNKEDKGENQLLSYRSANIKDCEPIAVRLSKKRPDLKILLTSTSSSQVLSESDPALEKISINY